MHRHPTARLVALRRLAPFAGCTDRQLARIDSLMTQVRRPAGRVLAVEGDPGRQCFLIESGTVAVTRNGEVINELGPGSWAGEMALLNGGYRTATLTTTGDTTLYVLNRREFATLLTDFPAVATGIVRVASRRLAEHTPRSIRPVPSPSPAALTSV